MAKTQTKYWYLLVMTDEGPKFVTDIDYGTKTAHWDGKKKPCEISEAWAKDLCIGLTWNGNTCYPVCMPCELDWQPYRYTAGHLKWVEDTGEEE